MRRAGHDWTAAQVARLCELKSAGKTNGQVAAELRLSRNAVAGQIGRLRAKSDGRMPPKSPDAAQLFAAKPKRSLDDRLAELMELRTPTPTLAMAAYQLGVAYPLVEAAWARICAGLGKQTA